MQISRFLGLHSRTSIRSTFVVLSAFLLSVTSLQAGPKEEEDFHLKVVKEMHKITEKYSKRLGGLETWISSEAFETYKADPTRSSVRFNFGYWYATDYHRILLSVGPSQAPFFNHLREKYAFVFGYVASDGPLILPDTINKPLLYRLKKDATPTEALDWIVEEKGLILIDCVIAYQLAFYNAIRSVVGDDQFNSFFMDSFALSPRLDETPLLRFMYKMPFHPTQIMPGQLVYFSNTPDYGKKHPVGIAKGYNCIISEITGGTNGEPRKTKYLIFGMDPRGVTSDEIYDEMAQQYNQSPQTWDLFPEGARVVFPKREGFNPDLVLTVEDIKIQAKTVEGHGGSVLMGILFEKVAKNFQLPAD